MKPINQLQWKCRRGMKELDILFQHYLDEYYPTASTDEQLAFETLIDIQDPVITDYLFNRATPETTSIAQIISIMRTYSQMRNR